MSRSSQTALWILATLLAIAGFWIGEAAYIEKAGLNRADRVSRLVAEGIEVPGGLVESDYEIAHRARLAGLAAAAAPYLLTWLILVAVERNQKFMAEREQA